MNPEKLDRLLALALFTGYAALLTSTVSSLGYARDEGFYFHAADSYRRWFELLLTEPGAAFERANVDRFFVVNHEHPALIKIAFMLSSELFHRRIPLFDEPGSAYRFAAMLLGALGVAVVYLWGARALGRPAALVAALSFGFMPRVFYHAHLACFDLPVSVLLLCTVYAYARSLETRRLRWAIAAGLFYGLSLATKHNAWLLPFALLAQLLVLRGSAWFRGAKLEVPRALWCMAAFGPLVLYVSWPWIWFDTFERLTEYVRFHTAHDYYNMEFLGETYWKPPMPRAYAWTMTLATVPLVTLILFAVGVLDTLLAFVGRRVRNEPGHPRQSITGSVATDLLWLSCVLVNYAPWWSSDTPIFGGTKHWIGAYPFLCLLAGRGFVVTLSRWTRSPVGSRSRLARWVSPLAGVSVVLGPVLMTARSHPWGLSFYTPLVGGAAGAASLGLNRTFWGYTTGAVTAPLNEHAPPGAAVYLHDTAFSSWEMLLRDGRVRRDLRGTLAIHESEFALYHHEPHMRRVEYQIWANYGTASPLWLGVYDGVPVVWVYRRAGRAQEAFTHGLTPPETH